MSNEKKPSDELLPAEQEVVAYLRQDQDFFSRHPSLLSELNLPHISGKTVSLVEHQVAILRERNVESRRRLNQLLQTAQDNDNIFTKTRALTLSLLEAKNLHALNEVLATHVLVDFEADFVCCHIAGAMDKLDHIHVHAGQIPFTALFGLDPSAPTPGTAARCTTLRSQEVANVFPNAGRSPDSEEDFDSASAVLIPLDFGRGRDASQGALCIGSRNPHRFSPDMDTLFVTYIADVLSKVLLNLGVKPGAG
ncbi:MAG: DUF484 family protein [Pseudomonadota bacterium]